jgi:glycosyltransferase involved in cell wall biosynthesis
MKIAVNTRFLIKNKLEGIGWYTYETLKRITQNHPEHTFYFLFDRKPHSDFLFSSNIIPIVLHPQARHPLLWFIWFELSVKRFIKKNSIDLFFSPDGFMPLRCNVPTIITIHDLNFIHYPMGIPYLTRQYYNYFFPKFANKAKQVLTVSNYSKNDIVDSLKIPYNKVTVAFNGGNTAFSPLSVEEKVVAQNEYAHGKQYFVFVGALNPRKNVARLIRAFELFFKKSKFDFKLVIVGEPMFMTADIAKGINSLSRKDSVIFTGRLQIEKLRFVIGGATALTYVPYFEGFGIPLVEAMRCHIPIIASNKTSIPEVVAEAAFIVDPFNAEQIADAMVKVAESKSLQADLAAKSAARKEMFSWDITAKTIYECMEKLVEEKKNA